MGALLKHCKRATVIWVKIAGADPTGIAQDLYRIIVDGERGTRSHGETLLPLNFPWKNNIIQGKQPGLVEASLPHGKGLEWDDPSATFQPKPSHGKMSREERRS